MVRPDMSLSEIIPSVRELSAADKLRLIRVLAEDVAPDSGVTPLESSRTYVLSTPVFEPGAAQALLEELKSGSN
jgi:hypothetical protein